MPMRTPCHGFRMHMTIVIVIEPVEEDEISAGAEVKTLIVQEDVDDVLPLASSFPKVRMCQPETELNWASATLWNNNLNKGEEQDKDPDPKITRNWPKENKNPGLEELSAQSPVVKTL